MVATTSPLRDWRPSRRFRRTLRRPGEDQGAREAARGIAWSAPSVEHRILLVDDDLDILASMCELLEVGLGGVKVLTAASAPQALAILGRERVDLVISDERMPGMCGVELLREARRVSPLTPRVLYSAFPEPRLASRAFVEAGCSFFVPKITPLEEILDLVRAILKGRLASAPATRTFSDSRPMRNPSADR